MHYWSNYSHQRGNYTVKKFVETLKIASVITIQWSYNEQFHFLCVCFSLTVQWSYNEQFLFLCVCFCLTVQWSYNEQFLCVCFQSGILILKRISKVVCVCVCVFVFVCVCVYKKRYFTWTMLQTNGLTLILVGLFAGMWFFFLICYTFMYTGIRTV